MVVYTEEEVIEKCNEAEALGAERAASDRDQATSENRLLRRHLNDCREAIRQIVESETIKNVCGWYTEIERARDTLATTDTITG